jgi:hypothetical protein
MISGMTRIVMICIPLVAPLTFHGVAAATYHCAGLVIVIDERFRHQRAPEKSGSDGVFTASMSSM